MNKMLNYKGYFGSVEVSIEDGVLHGKIQCVNDIVTYEAETPDGLKSAFEEAVIDYLDTCKQLGKSPDKPMSCSFNIRIGSELHKKAYLAACKSGTTLNDYVKKAVEEKVSERKEIHFHFEEKESVELLSGGYVIGSASRSKWMSVDAKGRPH